MKKIIIGLFMVAALFIAGCVGGGTGKSTGITSLEDLYKLDSQRKFIGEDIGDFHFTDIKEEDQFHGEELFEDKVLMIQSFTNGCPSCVKGIADYNYLYDKYKDQIEVVYMNVDEFDTIEGIEEIKNLYNGREWHWLPFQSSLIPLYQKFNIKINDMTFIVDKGGEIAYADSFSVPLEMLEEELRKLGVQ